MINSERILTVYQDTWSWINPISKIIEAVVTNNIGYDFKGQRIFEEGTRYNTGIAYRSRNH